MWGFRRRSIEGAEDQTADSPAHPQGRRQSESARVFALGEGRPLEPNVRDEMEGRLSHGLRGVRVHEDSEASEAARDLGASAYTVGEHVIFAEGKFAPETRAGRELLAHELTHTVQQSGAGPVPVNQSVPVEPAGTSLERDAAAIRPGTAAPHVAVQRQPAPQSKQELQEITVFVASPSQRNDVQFARREGKADAARIRKGKTLSAEDRQIVNAKLKFFDGDAWRAYGREVKPALIEVTREEIEMPAEWMGASGPGAKRNKAYAREQGEQDAKRIRAAGILDADLREELNEKLRFFEEEAWEIYGQAIKPALVEAKHAEYLRDYELMAAYYASERQSQLELRDEHLRSEIHGMTYRQIYENWDRGKKVWTEIARSPNNGLKQQQLLEIWRLLWGDRVNALRAREIAIGTRQIEGDVDRAHREYEAAVGMISGINDADEFLVAAEAAGKNVTLSDIDQAVAAARQFREGIGLLAMALGGIPGAGPPEPEPFPEPPPPAAPAPPPARQIGFRPPNAPEPAPAPPPEPAPLPPAASAPKASIGFRPPGAPKPQPPAPPTHVSPPVAGFGRQRVQPEPIKPPPDEPPMQTQMPPARQMPRHQAPPTAPPRYESPRAAAGRVEPADQARIKQLNEWEKSNKVSGDVPGLARRLRSNDKATREEARVEFEETKARVAKGEKVDIEEYGEKKPREPSRVQRISTPQKQELEDSDWLNKRLPDGEDRRSFMDWLKKRHKEGELGPEVPEGRRETEGHVHLAPGSREAEAAVREWEREKGRRPAGG